MRVEKQSDLIWPEESPKLTSEQLQHIHDYFEAGEESGRVLSSFANYAYKLLSHISALEGEVDGLTRELSA
ncbi:MAG: hypothetical protein SF029_26015 [bacterium]|nr:hypothetical protein [bacterium]